MRKLAITLAGLASIILSMPAFADRLATVTLSNGVLQVFEIEPNGKIRTRWKQNPDPNAPWTNWIGFQTPSAGVTDVSGGTLPDGRAQIFARLTNGTMVTCWKATTAGDSQWTPWQPFN
jgi:hypothetical protein